MPTFLLRFLITFGQNNSLFRSTLWLQTTKREAAEGCFTTPNECRCRRSGAPPEQLWPCLLIRHGPIICRVLLLMGWKETQEHRWTGAVYCSSNLDTLCNLHQCWKPRADLREKCWMPPPGTHPVWFQQETKAQVSCNICSSAEFSVPRWKYSFPVCCLKVRGDGTATFPISWRQRSNCKTWLVN